LIRSQISPDIENGGGCEVVIYLLPDANSVQNGRAARRLDKIRRKPICLSPLKVSEKDDELNDVAAKGIKEAWSDTTEMWGR